MRQWVAAVWRFGARTQWRPQGHLRCPLQRDSCCCSKEGHAGGRVRGLRRLGGFALLSLALAACAGPDRMAAAPLRMDCPGYLDRTNPAPLRPGFACLDATRLVMGSGMSTGTGASTATATGGMRAVEQDGKIRFIQVPSR